MNKVFQFVWFMFFEKRIKENLTTDLFDGRMVSMNAKLKLTKWFGGAKVAMFGDSNKEAMDDYGTMKLFPEVTVNLGIGGTRTEQWVEFFKTIGKDIYEQIKDKKIVINVGGNNVLQGKMDVLESSYKELVSMFPNAFHVNIPSIHGELLFQDKDKLEELEKALVLANSIIESIVPKDKLIDIRGWTGTKQTEAIVGVHSDPIHYSDSFDKKVRVPLILKKLYET